MELDFSPVWAGLPQLLAGALVTVEITAASLLLGCAMGLLVGIGRLNPKRRVIYALCTAYVAAIRGTPLLVQLFILFFGLPQFGILLPAFVCGVIGLGIYSGAYVSEVVRGAIQSIDKGQMEAARSIGMSSGLAMRTVVLPQAVVRMIPPLGNEFIALIKNSALVSLLTIHDLMHEGQKNISVSYRSLEVYLAIAVVYFILTGITGYLLHIAEPKIYHFAITTKGILAHNEFYTFDTIQSFFIHTDPPLEGLLSLHTRGRLVSHVHIPLSDLDQSTIRLYLREHLKEEPRDPSMIDILEKLLHI